MKDKVICNKQELCGFYDCVHYEPHEYTEKWKGIYTFQCCFTRICALVYIGEVKCISVRKRKLNKINKNVKDG